MHYYLTKNKLEEIKQIIETSTFQLQNVYIATVVDKKLNTQTYEPHGR